MKIDNLPLRSIGKQKRREFWETVAKLEIGQSFLAINIDSNIRNGLSIAEILLGRSFVTRMTDEGPRVGRTA